MSEQKHAPEALAGSELNDAELEAVAGGGIIDDIAAAAEYVKEKINEIGQQIVQAAQGQ